MKKVIKMKLEPKSIDEAIRELRAYKEDLERRVQLLVKILTDNGANIARAKVVEMGAYDTGELLSSIESCVSGSVGFIRVNAEFGIFVEFGTGIVGERDSHPAADAFNWEYDINDHGEEGWFYPYNSSRKHKYKFNPETGQKQPWTAGREAKPFMYETALKLKDEFPVIVREVFK